MPGNELESARVVAEPRVCGPNAGFRIQSLIKPALLLGFILWIVIPAVPYSGGTGLDGSWAIGLSLGHANRMNFGRDIVFTYGPLGYLTAPTFPEAEPWAVFTFAWGMALVIGWTIWRICQSAKHWTTICLYLGVFWFCGAFILGGAVERILAAIIAITLVIAVRLDAKPWPDVGTLFVVAGFVLLTKFNLGVLALAIALYFEGLLLFLNFSELRRELRPAIAALLCCPCTLIGLYWIVEGTPLGLIGFLRNSAEIARGHSEAMALPGPYWVAAAAVLSCALLWFCIPMLTNERRRVLWGVPLLVVIGFLCFKSAMVREDAHAVFFPFEMAMASLLVVALAPTKRNRIIVGAFATATLALGITTLALLWPEYLPSLDRLTGRAAVRNLQPYLNWKTAVRRREDRTRRSLVSEQLPAAFAPYLSGRTVAAYPWQIALIMANHLRWQPLPVFQAYSAYTPALDRLNARKLEDASGPEEILLSWSPTDYRQMSYEAPESWRALLNWYDLQFMSPTLYLLGRRSTPRFDAPILDSSRLAQWGQTIQLPPFADDEALVMYADIRESLSGILTRTLFRGSIVRVRAAAIGADRFGTCPSNQHAERRNRQRMAPQSRRPGADTGGRWQICG